MVPDLVIFDCDGVLVDSELIFARILAECLVAVDFPTTTDEAIALGFGKNRTTLSAAVAARFGQALPETFFETFRRSLGCRLRARAVADARNRGTPRRVADAALCRLERPSRPGPPTPRDRPGCCHSSTRTCSAPRRSLLASPRPTCSCSRRGSSARGLATAPWSRTASPASRRRSPPKFRSSAFAAAAIAPTITPIG